MGVPGRLRRALLRLLREAHGEGGRAGRRRAWCPCGSAPRSARSTRRTATRTGPTVADDGTPAGYPNERDRPRPDRGALRRRVGPGQPEAARQPRQLQPPPRDPERQRPDLRRLRRRRCSAWSTARPAALTIWTQDAVGTAEPERSTYHSIHERLEFTHREYAQAEYARAADERRDRRHLARRRAPDARALRQVRGLPGPAAWSPWRTSWFPGPISHPYPGRLELPHRQGASTGDPQLPVVGLPDCENAEQRAEQPRRHRSASTTRPSRRPCRSTPASRPTTSRRSGSRCPRTTRRPATPGSRRTSSIHLQAFRLGDILFTVCSCEQWFDQSRNIKTRTDKVAGNEHLGYDWAGAAARYNGDLGRHLDLPRPAEPVDQPARRSRPRTSCA